MFLIFIAFFANMTFLFSAEGAPLPQFEFEAYPGVRYQIGLGESEDVHQIQITVELNGSKTRRVVEGKIQFFPVPENQFSSDALNREKVAVQLSPDIELPQFYQIRPGDPLAFLINDEFMVLDAQGNFDTVTRLPSSKLLVVDHKIVNYKKYRLLLAQITQGDGASEHAFVRQTLLLVGHRGQEITSRILTGGEHDQLGLRAQNQIQGGMIALNWPRIMIEEELLVGLFRGETPRPSLKIKGKQASPPAPKNTSSFYLNLEMERADRAIMRRAPFHLIINGAQQTTVVFKERGLKDIELPFQQPESHITQAFVKPIDNGKYYLFLPKYRQLDGTVSDSILMRASDGLFLPLGPHDVDQAAIDDELSLKSGILSIKGVERKIDLERFESECKSPWKPHPTGTAVPELSGLIGIDRIDPYRKELYPDDKSKELIYRIAEGLSKVEVKAVSVLGNPGDGKTSTALLFARMVADGLTPIPRTWPLFFLDRSIIAGAMYTGTMEERANVVIKYFSAMPGILVLDDISLLTGAGTSVSNPNDILGHLRPAISKGIMRVLALDSAEPYNAKIGKSFSLGAVFTPLKMSRRSAEEKIEIVKNWLRINGYESVSQDLLSHANQIIERYSAEASLSSLINFIDAITSKQKISGGAKISKEVIEKYARERFDLPPYIFDDHSRLRIIEQLKLGLDAEIAGYTAIKKELVEAIEYFLFKIKNPMRPLSISLNGPPGRGKSSFGKVVAEGLELGAHEINMELFAGASSLSDFLGRIEEIYSKNAMAVVIFEEIDKAHPDILKSLLSALETGILRLTTTDQSNHTRTREMKVSESLFFFTSNAGTTYVQEAEAKGIGFDVDDDRRVVKIAGDSSDARRALERDGLPSALVDRMDHIFFLTQGSREEFKMALEIHLEKLFHRLSLRETEFPLARKEQLIEELTATHYENSVGKRTALRALEQILNSEKMKEIRSALNCVGPFKNL